jgi:hypothetical protein
MTNAIAIDSIFMLTRMDRLESYSNPTSMVVENRGGKEAFRAERG